MDELKTSGSISRGWLGVQIQDFTPELASELGMKDQKGAIIADVVDNSPAARAGFAQGDVVVSLNGTAIADSKALTRQVASVRAGDTCGLHGACATASGATLSATIEKRDAERVASADQTPSDEPSSLGMSLMAINPALRQQYELDANVTGVVVGAVDPDSEAARKGLNAGDVIKRVGAQPVRLPSDVARGVEDARRGGS